MNTQERTYKVTREELFKYNNRLGKDKYYWCDHCQYIDIKSNFRPPKVKTFFNCWGGKPEKPRDLCSKCGSFEDTEEGRKNWQFWSFKYDKGYSHSIVPIHKAAFNKIQLLKGVLL